MSVIQANCDPNEKDLRTYGFVDLKSRWKRYEVISWYILNFGLDQSNALLIVP